MAFFIAVPSLLNQRMACNSIVPEALNPRRLQALQACLDEGAALLIHSRVLQAVRGLAQDTASSKSARARLWALGCVAALAPCAAVNVRRLTHTKAAGQLSNLELLVSTPLLALHASSNDQTGDLCVARHLKGLRLW